VPADDDFYHFVAANEVSRGNPAALCALDCVGSLAMTM